MITCQIMGGLGNQLFQIFTTIACALEQNQTFGFVYYKTSYGITPRSTYWDNLLLSLKKNTHPSLPKEEKIIKENGFEYHKLPAVVPSLVPSSLILLFGYFQSHLYFEKYWDQIYKMVHFDLLKERVREKIRTFLVTPFLIKNEQSNCSNILKREKNEKWYKNAISIHFRIGDYKNLQDYHNILSYEYYEKSIYFILDEIEKREKKKTIHQPQNIQQTRSQSIHILYFCEEKDKEEVNIILKKLKTVFPTIEFIKATDELEDWEQMLWMSCCKYNIIANSTFSWWGAYLNTSPDRIVCYPSTWFGPKKSHLNTSNLFPTFWKKIE